MDAVDLGVGQHTVEAVDDGDVDVGPAAGRDEKGPLNREVLDEAGEGGDPPANDHGTPWVVEWWSEAPYDPAATPAMAGSDRVALAPTGSVFGGPGDPHPARAVATPPI